MNYAIKLNCDGLMYMISKIVLFFRLSGCVFEGFSGTLSVWPPNRCEDCELAVNLFCLIPNFQNFKVHSLMSHIQTGVKKIFSPKTNRKEGAKPVDPNNFSRKENFFLSTSSIPVLPQLVVSVFYKVFIFFSFFC